MPVIRKLNRQKSNLHFENDDAWYFVLKAASVISLCSISRISRLPQYTYSISHLRRPFLYLSYLTILYMFCTTLYIVPTTVYTCLSLPQTCPTSVYTLPATVYTFSTSVYKFLMSLYTLPDYMLFLPHYTPSYHSIHIFYYSMHLFSPLFTSVYTCRTSVFNFSTSVNCCILLYSVFFVERSFSQCCLCWVHFRFSTPM